MKDVSYEILDLFKTYGSGEAGAQAILDADSRKEVLFALSPMGHNKVEWLNFGENDSVLEIGGAYGSLTGLFAARCKEVTVSEELDENVEVSRLRNGALKNVTRIPRINWKKLGEDPLKGKTFDWIFFLNPPKGLRVTEALSYLRTHLSAGGRLVFACENALGLAYLSGKSHDVDQAAFARGELETALENAGFSQSEFYYPMPGKNLPGCIYSDRYLPAKGDVSDPADSFDEDRLVCMQEGEVNDRLIDEGLFAFFANAFLVVASMDAERQPVIFAKYNATRKPEFQIVTKIVEKDGARLVEKSAVQEAGKAHIASFEKKAELFAENKSAVQALGAALQTEIGAVTFPFVKGVTLDEELAAQIVDGKVPVKALEEAFSRVFEFPKEARKPFAPSESFGKVFGEVPALSDESYPVSNIDGLFENVMDVDGKLVFIDYEWVFDFAVPRNFLRWRLFFYFYNRHREQLSCKDLSEFLALFGIDEELHAVYDKMERAFQTYVHGDDCQGTLAPYLHEVKRVELLLEREKELMRARDRIVQLDAEIEEKNIQIRKEQEVQRLTNNHVHNLEIIIRDLRHELNEVGKLATYLNGHEALIFKARRKLGNEVSKAFPKGTRKRKVLDYGMNTVKHPVRYGKLYATSEGRNRIEGDFQIGDGYLTSGKLHFPPVPKEGPTVSIIIPCYNQIAYTYACLKSILEHTTDVSYEVIIADDVSTDATANLSRYASGLVICRNKKNQGFLLNCNHAAKKARGKYIFFLNNDTQVTPGWLSSLVKLIESDPTIGMVGSKLVYPDGRLQEAGGIIWSDGSGWNYGRLDNPDKADYNYVKDVDYISGAAIMLSKKLWEQIGGFDTRFAPAYYEDTDLAFEVRKAGYRVVYQPLSKVIHFEGISNGTDVNGTGLKRYQAENLVKFREKWAEELKKQCVNDGNPNPFRARERAQDKEIILVVDHYVPTFDRDAGSKATFQYLKMFQKKGFVVKFLGDNYAHEEPYTTVIQQMGIEILYGEDYAVGIWDWLKKNGNEIAFAYLNRPHIATKYVDFMRENTNMKIIYFGHDLHFLRLTREYELDHNLETKRSADYWKSMEMTMMHKADMSYFPSYVEVDVVHEIDPDIRAKAISLYVYDTFLDKLSDDFAQREDIMFVGGFAHPPNADGVLWFAREVFPLIRKELPNVQFYIAGSKMTDEIKALEQPGNGIKILGFISDEELTKLYTERKLAVVPLRYGAGVKGKVLEALYNGIPTVTTSIGAEGIPSVEEALVVEDEAEAFANAVVSIYRDNDRCKAMAHATQDYMKKHFSMDGAWEIVKEDFTV